MYRNRKKIAVVLLVFMITGMINAAPARAEKVGFLQNIGDLISLGANTVRELQDAIKITGGEVRKTLETLSGEIQEIIDLLSKTYQDNLLITIDSVDELTRKKLLEFEQLLFSVNEMLQEDLRVVSQEMQNIITTTAQQSTLLVAQITESLNNSVVVVGQTAAYVVDKTTYNLILIISVVLLGIGLLIFIWILFTKKLPKNAFARVLALVFIFAFLGVFAALIFIPQTRVYAVTAVGGSAIKLESAPKVPKVLFVNPEKIKVGTDKEIAIQGINLTASEEKPRVYLGSIELPVKANSDFKIIADVSRLTPSYNRMYLLSSDNPAESQAVPSRLFSRDEIGKYKYIGKFNESAPVVIDGKVPEFSRSGATLLNPRTVKPGLTKRIATGINLGRTLQGQQTTSRMAAGSGAAPVSASVFEGSYNVSVFYGSELAGTAIITIEVPPPPKKPADLIISSLSISPQRQTLGSSVQVDITVKNTGESNADKFNVEWRPQPYVKGKTETVQGLEAGASKKISFLYKYDSQGSFVSTAIADTDNNVGEINEENNTLSASVDIVAPPTAPDPVYNVTVEIYKIYVKNCQDSGLTGSSGELWFEFDINGKKARYPSSGEISAKNGDTISLESIYLFGIYLPSRTIRANLNLKATDRLRIWARGTDVDDTSADDSLGLIEVSHGIEDNFGAGDREAGDNVDFKIYYRVKVIRLQ